MGQVWSVNAEGGYLANPKLSKSIRHASQPMLKFRQFVRVEPGFGKNKGEKIYFDRVSNVGTAGGTLDESTRIPETKVTISQGEVVVNEYGNSIPYTGKLDTLSEFSVDNLCTVALRNDMAKVLDSAVCTEFKTCKVKMIPTGTTSTPTVTVDTDGNASTSALRDVQAYDFQEAADYLEDTLKAEKYDGDNYICIGRTGVHRKIFDSTEWSDAAKYGDPERLFAGEIGRWYNIRFVKETNSLATVLGTTSYKGEAIMFGADPLVEGVATPEEIRAKIPEDYGRSKGVAWYGIMGWSLTYDTASEGEAKVVHITSA